MIEWALNFFEQLLTRVWSAQILSCQSMNYRDLTPTTSMQYRYLNTGVTKKWDEFGLVLQVPQSTMIENGNKITVQTCKELNWTAWWKTGF